MKDIIYVDSVWKHESNIYIKFLSGFDVSNYSLTINIFDVISNSSDGVKRMLGNSYPDVNFRVNGNSEIFLINHDYTFHEGLLMVSGEAFVGNTMSDRVLEFDIGSFYGLFNSVELIEY